MAEFEDKLNSILGNQEAMSQIMALARSLSGDQPAASALEGLDGPQPEPSEPPATDLSALMGQIDPKMLQVGMDVLRQVQGTEDRSAALLNALKPFLRETRRARLDRALQMTRMVKLLRAAMSAMGGEEGERV
ncbi:hypothetical protein D1646_00585 [Pseudoflavonifractor sp. 60]|uniref:hypothetical protein n=1 Tax=Pseudoflavonifractor sp. 60 TaxID=2304576 RepID=UPI00136F5785|nr:hypothetical protein [Pseudoflavonifractor sp. 60]NBI65325.1 hypothetical protein [Pseudoflavonifractor sp. 60]